MAILSDKSYDRLAKAVDSHLVFMNTNKESFKSGELITLKRTKTKIATKWALNGVSDNVFPFTHAALVIDDKTETIYSINPLEALNDGFIHVDYESADLYGN